MPGILTVGTIITIYALPNIIRSARRAPLRGTANCVAQGGVCVYAPEKYARQLNPGATILPSDNHTCLYDSYGTDKAIGTCVLASGPLQPNISFDCSDWALVYTNVGACLASHGVFSIPPLHRNDPAAVCCLSSIERFPVKLAEDFYCSEEHNQPRASSSSSSSLSSSPATFRPIVIGRSLFCMQNTFGPYPARFSRKAIFFSTLLSRFPEWLLIATMTLKVLTR